MAEHERDVVAKRSVVLQIADHVRLMGVIVKESISHPTVPTTIIYDSRTGKIEATTPASK
ncbi:MAG: hypothetical protein NTZ07_04140 [Candidatus Woesebacteria bacterium]|nr:hypothetical protein [Candidatus Woesebacteria bacterium]